MSFPKYPKYKDSGVEWLGCLPEHWVVRPLKRAVVLIESGTSVNAADFPAEPGVFGVLKTSCVYTEKFDWNENKTVNEDDLGRVSCPLRKDSLIVSRMNTPDLVGATGLVTEAPDGIFLPDRLWQVYFGKSHSPEFLFYFTKSREYREQVKMACSGTSASMQNLGQDDFRSLLFAVPSWLEQNQIAHFLDHETAKIDALIAEQKRLIELLKEKRQAVISHAVTKGLNPNASMKDSGVEWLGEVPAHWEVLTLGRVANAVKTGGTPSDDQPSPDIFNGIDWYTPGDFGANLVLGGAGKFVSESAISSGDAKIFPSGSVLIVSIGATLGKVGYTCKPASANQQINAVLPSRGVNGYFLAYSLSVKIDAMRFLSNASTIGIMNQEKTKDIWVALPAIQEQGLITEFLDEKTAVFDELICEAENGVFLLHERRSALISAAVTGEIDVRGWQSPEGHVVREERTTERGVVL
ncbi:restriction endonuclease subunit S [Alcanivorax sp. 1008]|uniref:restriction endonuclease subunit S n=1 Tax=Alcanivorax sp. 1008 TaxID=2816853 RepID=UPI001D85D16E|nr:restriction endonuclease subunit S [Alcanivorax sp. 1008]MCC1498048.1 restriction endonuclease subunit S [Alcanivorax sp. 1008]